MAGAPTGMAAERHGGALLGGAALAFALCLTSGCFCTAGMWGSARQLRPQSRAVGVERTPEGGERVILSLRECDGHSDGYCALDIPSGWRDMPTRRSAWGSEIPELAQPATSLVPVAAIPSRSEMTKLRGLKFPAVAHGRRPWYGSTYGVIYVMDMGRFSAEIFGYADAREEWVRLGGVELDPGRASRGRTAAAAVLTPVTLVADFLVGLGIVCAAGSGGDIDWPRFMFYLPRLIAKLDGADPRRRATAAVELRRYGAHAKVAVPALRRALADGDGALSAIAVTLKEICPRDPDFYVPGVIDALRTGSAGGRRDAARLLGEWRTKEAVPALIDTLRHEDHGVRGAVAQALGLMGPYAWKAVPALGNALQDESRQVRRAAKKSLRSIRDQVSEVAVTDAFHEHRPDEQSLVAVLPVSNETPDMDYPPLTRRHLAPALEELGYRVMACEECDATLKEAGITQAGQLGAVEPQTLAELLGADFAVFGNVEDCGTKHRIFKAITRRFTASFKMIHTPTGELLWKARAHGEVNMPCLLRSCVQKCVSNALSTLPRPGSGP